MYLSASSPLSPVKNNLHISSLLYFSISSIHSLLLTHLHTCIFQLPFTFLLKLLHGNTISLSCSSIWDSRRFSALGQICEFEEQIPDFVCSQLNNQLSLFAPAVFSDCELSKEALLLTEIQWPDSGRKRCSTLHSETLFGFYKAFPVCVCVNGWRSSFCLNWQTWFVHLFISLSLTFLKKHKPLKTTNKPKYMYLPLTMSIAVNVSM